MTPTTVRTTLSALALALASLSSQAADSVKVGLGPAPNVVSLAPFAAAQALGLFKDADLDVEAFEITDTLPALTSKRVTLAVGLPEPILNYYQQNPGKTLPIAFFYNLLPQTFEFAVAADSNIQRLEDLKGKRVGTGALNWPQVDTTRAVLKSVGIGERDFTFSAVGVLGAGFHALRSQRIDALNFNDSWNDMFELTGFKLRRLHYPDAFRGLGAGVFITHADTLREQPELLARFGRAYNQGQRACVANPAFCVRAVWQQYPQTRPSQGALVNNEADAVTLLSRRLQLIEADPAASQGRFDHARITGYLAAMQGQGYFKGIELDLPALFSNQLAASFTDYDRAALDARAKAAQ